MSQKRPRECPIFLHGSTHRAYQLPNGLWRTWCGWTRSAGERLQPGEKVYCLQCIGAKVPDRLRGYEPPFESWS